MATSSEQINLTSFGGYSRGPGPAGGLRNNSFNTFCVPDVQPRTRIIAVCGPNDYQNNSSPQADGWFQSDNYLFHHLLEDNITFQAASQIWLTCVPPETLVEKYGEFVHGNNHSERRVVLDKSMLSRVMAPSNIKVVPGKDLLERFLITLHDETKKAVELNQPVLVFIFGHGDKESFGIAIGGLSDTNTAPRLSIAAFKAAVHPKAQICLVMTSCFLGGWVVNPDLNGQKPRLNTSALTAANHNVLSESWQASHTSGRAGGGIFATALVQGLIATAERSPGGSQTIDPEDELYYTPAYVSFIGAVFECLSLADRFHAVHGVTFASQDDKWAKEWRPRSGFPVAVYREQWNQLREIPKDTIAPAFLNRDQKENPMLEEWTIEDKRRIAAISRGLDGNTNCTITEKNIIRERAISYMSSKPGRDTAGVNYDHARLKLLISGEETSDIEWERLNNVLLYRRYTMEQATDYKNYLGLDFEESHEFDAFSWIASMATTKGRQDQEGQRAAAWCEMFSKAQGYILRSGLFDYPAPEQGGAYTKPREYLAVALVEAGGSWDEIKESIDKCLKLKLGCQKFLTQSPLADAVCSSRKVQKESSFWKTIGRKSKRFARSISPSKRAKLNPEWSAEFASE